MSALVIDAPKCTPTQLNIERFCSMGVVLTSYALIECLGAFAACFGLGGRAEVNSKRSYQHSRHSAEEIQSETSGQASSLRTTVQSPLPFRQLITADRVSTYP